MNARVDQDKGTGVSTVRNSSLITLDLKRTRSTLEHDPGFKEFGLGGLTDDRGQAARWVGVEVSGFQGSEQISVYQLSVDGASV